MFDRLALLRAAAPLVALLGLTARPALAQEIPCGRGPCMRPAEAGTHFLAEVNGGASLRHDGGVAFSGLLGAGGRLGPLRLYVVGEVGYRSDASTDAGSTGRGYHDVRSFRDLALGLRVYLAVVGPMRLLTDVQVGGTHVSAALDRPGLPIRHAAGWLPFFQLGAGLQVRLLHHLSVGLRGTVVATSDDLGGLRAMVAQTGVHRVALTAGLTCHF
ncbi:MAG: hypothetical protein IT371_18685 [Deltaproteobacteria bacterium]|nr:hypothetical protein [Deltaproteobacteria bacterium]